MTALMLPVQSGMTQVARELLGNVEHRGSDDLAACCERLGIEWMTWHLAVLPTGDFLVVHVQGPGSQLLLNRLAMSRHPFDRWLYASLNQITGMNAERSNAVQCLLPLADFQRIREPDRG